MTRSAVDMYSPRDFEIRNDVTHLCIDFENMLILSMSLATQTNGSKLQDIGKKLGNLYAKAAAKGVSTLAGGSLNIGTVSCFLIIFNVIC